MESIREIIVPEKTMK